MRRRKISLKRRRLHGSERQRCDQERTPAQRIAIGTKRGATRLPDLRDERREILMSQIECSFFSGDAARLLARGQAASGAFPCTGTG